MLSVAQAQAIVLEKATVLPVESVQVNAAHLGWIVAEDVASDIDAPPFDKAMMDGYAVRSADVVSGNAVLAVIEEVTAGQTPTMTVQPGQATRIMTGAPTPHGADAVVMVERTRNLASERVAIDDRPRPGQNILRRGAEMRQGDVVVRSGTRLRPQEFGLLSSVGRTTVQVYPAATVSILATGDELVEAHIRPGPGQIRNSNGPMLAAQASRAGGIARQLGIARDNLDELRSLIAEGLRGDILILSGGVSAGKLDLVPGVLQDLGVQAHFHKVEMKPGKPIFFGTKTRGEGRGTRDEEQTGLVPRPSPVAPCLVFGLPGNPVSSLVCFELFVRPAIRKSQGQPAEGPQMVRAELAEDFAYRTDRPTYHPADLFLDDGRFRVRAVPWIGSADLRGVLAANAFVVFPAGDHQHKAGQRFDVLQVE